MLGQPSPRGPVVVAAVRAAHACGSRPTPRATRCAGHPHARASRSAVRRPSLDDPGEDLDRFEIYRVVAHGSDIKAKLTRNLSGQAPYGSRVIDGRTCGPTGLPAGSTAACPKTSSGDANSIFHIAVDFGWTNQHETNPVAAKGLQAGQGLP